jgi:hypothetical protein
MRHLLAVALLAASGGCGPRIPSSYPGPPEVVLGTGVTSFVPVADGAEVPLVYGIQGGYHIWGSVRVRYMDPRELRLAFRLTFESDAKLISLRNEVIDLPGDGTAAAEHLGTFVFVPFVETVRGQRCRWRLDVTDLAARTVTVERIIVPVGPM